MSTIHQNFKPHLIGAVLLGFAGLYGTVSALLGARRKKQKQYLSDEAGAALREADAEFLPPGSSSASNWWMYEVSEVSDDDDEFNFAVKNDLSKDCIYLDYNGTTPIYPEVLHAMIPYLTRHYGNPSSSHVFGRRPREAVDKARRQILRELLKAPTTALSAIWFTSCGTESDNLAIQLALQSAPKKDKNGNGEEKLPHIVTCNVEHPAISGYLDALVEQDRIEVTYVPVATNGRVSALDMIAAIRPGQTVLVTMMLANNESGVLQPVNGVAEFCRRHGILIHTDAAQAAGKISCSLEDLGNPDMISLVGHKIGAPKGVACLYVRPGCLEEFGRSLENRRQSGILLIGGAQEFGRRGGTENVPSIVGFGKAAALAGRNLPENAKKMERIRNRLLDKLIEHLGSKNVRDNGPKYASLRLPNTLSVGLWGVHSGELLASMGDRVAASAGATCHSVGAVSSVLRAMQIPEEFARGTLRLSVGPRTTEAEVDRAAELIAKYTKQHLATKFP